MRIEYIGPGAGAYVPALDRDVEWGKPIDVADEAIASSLLEQRDNWRAAGPPASLSPSRGHTTSRAAKPAEEG